MALNQLRTVFVVISSLQLVVTFERQIFDFLGYMWIPIVFNFLNILLIIFGVFGALQKIRKYLFAYAVWSVLLILWNIFLICFYSNVGSLNREIPILSLGTGSVSWWESNGFGCHPSWGDSDMSEISWVRPTKVEGCLVDWYQVELVQSALILLLTLTSLPIAMKLWISTEKPFKSGTNNDKHRAANSMHYTQGATVHESCSPKPMTPRRVKRRSGSSTLRRSRRSYRNTGYVGSTGTIFRPPSARSSFQASGQFTQSEQNINSGHMSEFVPHTKTRSSLSRSAESVKSYHLEEVPKNKDQIFPSDPSYGKSASTPGYEAVPMTYVNSRNYRSPNYANNMVYGLETPLPAYEASECSYSTRATPQVPGPPAYNMHIPDYT